MKGGGTGSGLGTAVLKMLADEFEDVHRFVVAVYPSSDDDVITSPYNVKIINKLDIEDIKVFIKINISSLF
jgi:tubulin epsilon